ncbi:MAG: esterase [Acidimicrobiia bacterium]
MASQQIRGSWDEAFSPLVSKLHSQLEAGQHMGGALAVWKEGSPVVDVHFGERNPQGDPWEADTMVVAFSTTKGMASLALHMLANAGEIEYDSPVARYWPTFAKAGKEGITVRHILTHEAGLHRIRDYVDDPATIMDWNRMISIIESMEPAYPPGTANGYHATSFGWLVGELIRRVSGTDICSFVRKEIAEPLGLDGFYIGMPISEADRVAKLSLEATTTPQIPMAMRPPVVTQDADSLSNNRDHGNSGEQAASGTGLRQFPIAPNPLIEGAKALAPGLERIVANDTEVLTVPLPAANGVFTARSLAKAYSAIADTTDGPQGPKAPLLSPRTREKVRAIYNSRPDLVIGIPMMWRLGYHSVFTGTGVIPNAIGHFGFGGSGAFLDLDTHLSAALLVNKISLSFTAHLRFVELAGVALQCATK